MKNETGKQIAAAPAAASAQKCAGYPDCDGDLIAEPHEPDCPAASASAPVPASELVQMRELTSLIGALKAMSKDEDFHPEDREIFSEAAAAIECRGEVFDMRAHLQRQRDWSCNTFGPGPRSAGVVDHIRKELLEIEAEPLDLKEWIDVTILALDGAWRAGYSTDEIISALVAKQTKNEGRKWPDWRMAEAGKAIEHDRSADAHPAHVEGGSDEIRDIGWRPKD